MANGISDQNYVVYNAGRHPIVGYNFMLRVEAVFDLPCKSVKAISRELEFDYVQEGGLNDYVHIRNKQRLHDYVLGSEKEHNEILRQLTDEFLNARIDLNTVSSPQEAAKNINYLDKISNMSVYFNNIMDNNKDYFAALDTQTRQKIDARFAMLQKSQFPQKLTAAMGCYNIRLATGQFNSTDLDDETAKQSRQDAKDSFDNGKKTARSAILDYQNKLAVIDILQTTEQKRFEQDKENKERMGVSFPGGAEMRDYVKVKQCRDRFLEHPETYARNKALLDDSYTAYYRMTAERVEKTRQIDALTSVIEKLEKKAPAAGSEDALRKEAAEKTRSDAIKEETLLNNFLQGIETLMTDTLNGAERSEEDKRYAWFLQVNWESNSVEIAQTVNKMKDMDDSRNLLMTPDFLKRAKEKHEFVRSLDVFSQPFKLDLKGQPKNEADKAILKQNCDFAEAYAFGTAEQRKECLDKIVQMTLDLHFEPDMLDDPRQVLQKLPEYKTMSAKLTFIEDFKTHNPNYFDQLDEKKKAQLDRLRGFYANFGIALTNVSKLYGINMTENMNEGRRLLPHRKKGRKAHLSRLCGRGVHNRRRQRVFQYAHHSLPPRGQSISRRHADFDPTGHAALTGAG